MRRLTRIKPRIERSLPASRGKRMLRRTPLPTPSVPRHRMPTVDNVWLQLAAALGVTLAVLLATRLWMHRLVRAVVTRSEVNHALMLAAATLVVLPLIPDRSIGPFAAFNPRTAWTIVVLMMAVGALGHIAQRLLGSGAGLAAAGFASGFVSSVATIAAMGERAARTPALMRPAVAGAVLSSVATVVQMAAVLGATSLATLQRMALPLLLAGGAAALYGGVFTARTLRGQPPTAADAGRAFSLRRALGLAAVVSLVMVASAALEAWFGHAGLVVGAAIAGFADTHAAAMSVAALVAAGKLPAADAVVPILSALTTNSITKAVVSVTAGNGRFAGQIIPGLALLLAGAWGGHALGLLR